MCQTYTFYHICGHVHVKRTAKCSTEIKRQLDLARDGETAPINVPFRHKLTPVSSCREGGLFKIFLKSTVCRQCETTGIISEWLNTDPAIKFEIVREWHRNKRVGKDEVQEARTEEMATLCRVDSGSEISEQSNASRASQGGTPSSLVVAQIHAPPLASLQSPVTNKSAGLVVARKAELGSNPLEVMAPVMKDYQIKAVIVQTNVEVVEQKIRTATHHKEHNQTGSSSLKVRAASLREKLEKLIVESKKCAPGGLPISSSPP